MVILFQLCVALILSKTITCWLTGCNIDCHQGTCFWSVRGHWACKCNQGWFGDHCELECQRDCHNGHCQDRHGHSYCECNQGWHGYRCDQKCQIDCHNGSCQWSNQGNQGHWACTCNQGWHGERCDQEWCTSSSCGSNGNCNHGICECHAGFSGSHCEVAPVTSALDSIPTTTPTMSPTATPTPPTTTATMTKPPTIATETTTLVPTFTKTCSKFVTVLDMAEKVIETSNLATPCPSGNHSSHEAFVINICNLAIPSTWKQGYNVMTFCDKIPAYTPIASFENGKYSSADSRSGIFIGCLHGPDGFKAAFQRCDEVAEIESITVAESMFNNNPQNYFTLEH